MANVFDFFDPTRLHQVPRFEGDAAHAVSRQMKQAEGKVNASTAMHRILSTAISSHAHRIGHEHGQRSQKGAQQAQSLLADFSATQAQGAPA